MFFSICFVGLFKNKGFVKPKNTAPFSNYAVFPLMSACFDAHVVRYSLLEGGYSLVLRRGVCRQKSEAVALFTASSCSLDAYQKGRTKIPLRKRRDKVTL